MARTIPADIHANFFFDPDPVVFFSLLTDATSSSPAAFRNIADALKTNLEAVIWTASMPFHLVQSGVHQRRFDRILSAEKIRNLPVSYGENKTLSDEEVLALAKEKFKKESASADGRGALIDHIFAELDHLLQAAQTLTGARETLRQSEVLVWGGT